MDIILHNGETKEKTIKLNPVSWYAVICRLL